MNDAATEHRGLNAPGELATPAVAIYSPRYVWYVTALLTVVLIVNYMDRTALAVLMPAIKRDLELSDGQLGLLVGFAFFLFYAVCGLPLARWADRGIRRSIIALSLALWSVMTSLSGAAQNFWQLLGARAGLAVGEAGCIPASQSLLADHVPPKRRSEVFSVYYFGQSAGTMLGLVFAGWLAEHVGWRWTFVVLGAPGIVLAFIVRCTLKEPVRGALDAVTENQTSTSLRRTLGVLWQCRTYRLLTLYFVLMGFANHGLLQWWPSFYMRVFDVSLSAVGLNFGLAWGTGTALGTLVGGVLAHSTAGGDSSTPLRIGVATIALAVPLALGALFVESSWASTILVLLAALLWCVPYGSAVAVMVSVIPPQMRATGGAFVTFCISVLGYGLAPFCVGVLSDLLVPTFGAQSLRYAMLLPALSLVVVAFALHAVTRAIPENLKLASVRV